MLEIKIRLAGVKKTKILISLFCGSCHTSPVSHTRTWRNPRDTHCYLRVYTYRMTAADCKYAWKHTSSKAKISMHPDQDTCCHILFSQWWDAQWCPPVCFQLSLMLDKRKKAIYRNCNSTRHPPTVCFKSRPENDLWMPILKSLLSCSFSIYH